MNARKSRRNFFKFRLAEIRGDGDAVADFAVNLHDNFDGIFSNGGFVEGDPALFVNVAGEKFAPKFGGDMRHEWREHFQKVAGKFAREAGINFFILEIVGGVDEFHERADSGVERETVAQVFSNFLGGFVNRAAERFFFVGKRGGVIIFSAGFNGVLKNSENAPDAVQKSERAFNALVAPIQIAFDRRREQNEKPRGIGAVPAAISFTLYRHQ